MDDTIADAPPRLSNSDIRHANTVSVCRILRASAGMTRAELMAATGLARPTTVAILQRLIADGFVAEDEADRSAPAGGRPPAVLRFRTSARVVASVRFVAGRYSEAVLADVSGIVLARSVARRPRASDPVETTVAALAEQIQALQAERPDVGPLAAVAACLPGTIVRDEGNWTLPGRRGWSDVPVAQLMTKALGVPVGVVNIAAASLIGQLATTSPTPGPTVLVYLGQGVGAAVAVGGRLLDGASGSAGELGHCFLPGCDRRCSCGRIGCLEAVTSAAYLRGEYRRITGAGGRPSLAQMERNPLAEVRRTLTEAADRLALGASWLINVVNPDRVYFGGNPFTDGSSLFADTFAGAVARYAHRPNARAITVLPAPSTSVVNGAVRVAAELLPDLLRPALRLVH